MFRFLSKQQRKASHGVKRALSANNSFNLFGFVERESRDDTTITLSHCCNSNTYRVATFFSTSDRKPKFQSNNRPGRIRISSFSTISEYQYHTIADETLEMIQDGIDYYFDEKSNIEYEVSLSSGVLNISFPPHGVWVLNKQTPNRQIWVCSSVQCNSKKIWSSFLTTFYFYFCVRSGQVRFQDRSVLNMIQTMTDGAARKTAWSSKICWFKKYIQFSPNRRILLSMNNEVVLEVLLPCFQLEILSFLTN
jgi:frataxin-like iron-binding protein CyaY